MMRSLSRRSAWSPAVAVRAAVAIPFPPECGLSNALFIRNLNVLRAGLQGPLGEHELLLRTAILAALRDALVTLGHCPTSLALRWPALSGNGFQCRHLAPVQRRVRHGNKLRSTRSGARVSSRLLATPFLWASAQAANITVFAAASLKNALDDAAKKYEAKTGDKIVVSYAASSALAKQINDAAPADIFFSADLDWMDYLEQKKLIDTASRHTLLGNTLVLIAPKDSTVSLTVGKNFPLLQALGPDDKLAMASVDTVPAGKYGKAALTYFGVWDQVAPRVAQAENVRAALAFVARGETPLGIV